MWTCDSCEVKNNGIVKGGMVCQGCGKADSAAGDKKQPIDSGVDDKDQDIEDQDVVVSDQESDPEPGNQTHNQIKLRRYVCDRSVAKNWEDARKEWELIFIYEEAGGQCVCEHQPITDHCVLQNKLNHREIIVGNVCVQHFGGELAELSKSVFQNLKHVKKDPSSARANLQLIALSQRRGIISPGGATMYADCWRKRTRISDKQKAAMISMNDAILVSIQNKPRLCRACNRTVYAKKSQTNKIYFRCCDAWVNN